MKTAKMLITRILGMSTPAYIFLKSCLILSCISLGAAVVILFYAGDFSTESIRLYNLAQELQTAPQGLLLIGSIGSVCIEERVKK